MRRDWGGPFGVVTGGEMAALDRKAIEEYGIPAAALMERAGAEVARAVAEFAGDAIAGARVQVVCGTGNNGGDGFVAARTLANLGARVRISLVSPPERLRGDALAFYTAAVKMGVPVATIGEGDLRKFTLALRTADVIVDAILGTGSSGPLRPFVARLVAAINESQRPVIAVDLPTGVQADTGRVDPIAVKAKMTVAFGLPKVGHLLNPGRAYTGELRVAEIGFPRPLLDSATGRLWADKSWARTVFAPRPAHGHKGTFGRVVVIAGSYGMAGAAALAMNGALRSGAGLVTWMGPESLLPVVQTLVPEGTAIGLPERGGRVSADGVRGALAYLRAGDAVAIGPGLGTSEESDRFVLDFLEGCHVPAVVDTDALNALSRHPQAAEGFSRTPPRVLTPHPKEAARMLQTELQQIIDDPLRAAAEIVERWKCTALVKGAPTVVQGASGRAYINGSGDVSLATGGTGDVLTGVIASLIAQGYSPEHAAVFGAYIHGRSGGDRRSQRGPARYDRIRCCAGGRERVARA